MLQFILISAPVARRLPKVLHQPRCPWPPPQDQLTQACLQRSTRALHRDTSACLTGNCAQVRRQAIKQAEGEQLCTEAAVACRLRRCSAAAAASSLFAMAQSGALAQLPCLPEPFTVQATCVAGDLPAHLLALVCTRLLEQTAREPYAAPASLTKMLGRAAWTRQDIFHRNSAVTRQAILLASTCRAWQHAAVSAYQALQLRPQVNYNMPAVYLSRLLAEMHRGCAHITLMTPLLATPSVTSFINLARIGHLTAGGGGLPPESDGVSSVLASCTTLRSLNCVSLLASNWPPHLQHLAVDIPVLASPADVGSLLGSLQGLSRLAELTLSFRTGAVEVLTEADCFSGLATLNRLHVSLCLLPGSRAVPATLQSLTAAAARGVSCKLEVSLACTGDTAVRLRLWTALGACTRLFQLQLTLDFSDRQTLVSPFEHQLLARIQCRQLAVCINAGYVWSATAAWQMSTPLAIRAERMCCRFNLPQGVCVDWAVLAARPGIYLLSCKDSISVAGCQTTLPDFNSGWALVLGPQNGGVQGLPVSRFAPGPRGLPVWRNSNVLVPDLEWACSLLLGLDPL